MTIPKAAHFPSRCGATDLVQINGITRILKLRKRFRMRQTSFEHGVNSSPFVCFRGYGNLSTLSIGIPRVAFGRYVWTTSRIRVSKHGVTNNTGDMLCITGYSLGQLKTTHINIGVYLRHTSAPTQPNNRNKGRGIYLLNTLHGFELLRHLRQNVWNNFNFHRWISSFPWSNNFLSETTYPDKLSIHYFGLPLSSKEPNSRSHTYS